MLATDLELVRNRGGALVVGRIAGIKSNPDHSYCSSVSPKPVFERKATDAGKFPLVVGDDSETKRYRVGAALDLDETS
jgi:hypothetical protein